MGSDPHHPIDYAAPEAGRFSRRRAALRIIAGLFGAAGVGVAFKYLGSERPAQSVQPGAPAPIAVAKPPAAKPEPLEKAYRHSVAPLLDAFDQRNDAAADRAMVALHDRISMHRAGVAPFTREVVSWSTRFGVIKRYPGDLWRRLRRHSGGSTSVAQFVNEKFRRHVLSEQSLEADVTAVLAGFDEDMRASRNLLYSELSLPLAQIRTSHPAMAPALEQFDRDVQQRASQMTRSLAPDTLVAGLAAIAGGWVATDVAQAITSRIVTQVLTQLSVAMAAEGVEAGGATVGGAAAGGGAGSLGGPIGTVIGIGVGLVVGAIVDWRLSKKFETKVNEQCIRFLENLEARLRDGGGDSPGLNRLLHQTAAITGEIQRDAIWIALMEAQR